VAQWSGQPAPLERSQPAAALVSRLREELREAIERLAALGAGLG